MFLGVEWHGSAREKSRGPWPASGVILLVPFTRPLSLGNGFRRLGVSHPFGMGEFIADDVHIPRCVDPQANGVRTDSHNGDGDVIANQNLLTRLP